jgi:signal transduction histidine kinase
MHNVTLRASFDGDPTAVCLAAADGAVLESNAAFADLFGFADAGQARGVRLDTLFVDGAAWHRAVDDAVAGTPPARFDAAGRTKEGRALLVACRLRAAGDPDNPGAVLAWFTDQTEFAQAPRTTTGARLVRAIGHDLGNMMMVIRGFAEVLVRELPEGGKGRGWVAQIRTASDRAAVLGEELLAGARPPDQGLEDSTPAALLDAVLPLLRRAAGPGVEVEIHGPGDARHIRTNREQFESVLLSLVSLARIDRPKDMRLRVGMSWTDGEPSQLVLGVSGADPGRAWEVRFPP